MTMIRFAALAASVALVALPAGASAQASAAPPPLPAPPAPAVAEAPALSLGTRTALRCAAAFALVSGRQQRGEAPDWPTLGPQAREFFVRISARAMDEAQLPRDAVATMLRAETETLAADPASLAALRGPCVMLLESAAP